jgi:predicted metal-dependent peptidase
MNVAAEVQRAEGKIQVAKERLARHYPFHVALLSRMRVAALSTIATMAVTTLADQILLLHNPRFVLACAIDQLGGLLLHELHHVLFHHLTMDMKDYPDTWALSMAQEVTVNEYIVEPLPPDAVRLEDFPDLPARESTSERYERLRKTAPPQRTLRSTVDDHALWSEIHGDDQSEAALVQAIEAAAALAPVPKDLWPIMKAHAGLSAGAMEEVFVHQKAGMLPWRQILRRYVGQALEVRPIYGRLPRRFPQLVGMMPGLGRQAAKVNILAVIDTSASITSAALSRIDSELRKLTRHANVVIVECDAAIQAVYAYRQLERVHGRGGTDLRPPFDRQFLAQQRADLLIYFTDGYGPAPEQPPRQPVIWCLTKDGEQPAAWGKVVRME